MQRRLQPGMRQQTGCGWFADNSSPTRNRTHPMREDGATYCLPVYNLNLECNACLLRGFFSCLENDIHEGSAPVAVLLSFDPVARHRKSTDHFKLSAST